MGDHQLQPHSSLPLLAKPERVDSFMKFITGKTYISRWSTYIASFGRKNKECMPSDVAVLDAKSKSFLLGRIDSLEDRLMQLSLEIENRRISRASTASTSSGAKEPVSSYPVFNNPRPRFKDQLPSNVPICDNGLLEQKKKQKQASLKKKKNKRDEQKTCKNGNKNKKGMKKGNSWPHLKILGC